MKKSFLLLLLLAFAMGLRAQQTALVKLTDTAKLYNPAADARADIAAAVKLAAKTHKHVLLQMGGNWCSWCIRFNDLVKGDPELSKTLRDNYVVVHINYSKENTNERVFADLGYPQRFGFPVFVILDGKGNRLHTQNSGYLQQDNGHSKARVLEFFNDWSPAAVDPRTYEKQVKTKS